MTTDEIVRALRRCVFGIPCGNCPVVNTSNCVNVMHVQAAALIEQLTAENTALRKGTKMKRSQKQDYEKQLKSLQALADRRSSEIKKLQDDLRWKTLLAESALDTQERAEKAEAERDALREKVPQWVNVEDSLPELWRNEEDGELANYMIYSPYFGVDIGNYHKEAETWLCVGLPCTVTHWMPLPEAPEKGEKA